MSAATVTAPWWTRADCRDCRDFDQMPDYVQVGWCNQCPVQNDCLIAALEEEGRLPSTHRAGIRGGVTPIQRWRIAHELPVDSGSSPDDPNTAVPPAQESRAARPGEGPGPGLHPHKEHQA